MGATATYFRHIKEAVASIFDGMAVSASHLIRKPYTIQYPDRMPVRVQDTLPFRYRGILDVDMEICTGCLACDRACPIDCIAIAIEKNAQTREILISQFDIDMAKCMYCGLCSEVCPTGSIHHTTEFEGADFSVESLIRRFITEPFVAYKPKKGPEPDPDVAKLLDRGMKYVDEWAQPGSDKPPANAAAAAKPAAAASPAGTAAPKPAPPPVAVAPRPPRPATVGAGEPAPTVAGQASAVSPPPAATQQAQATPPPMQAEPAAAQQAQPAPVTQPPPAPASPTATAASQQPQTATAPKDASPAEGGDAAPAAPSKPESGSGEGSA
jgi:NADH-quinone oxidoreductase subunit I